MAEETQIKYEHPLFKKILGRHKVLISTLGKMVNYEPGNKQFGILKPINNYGLMLCLYDADFKCQYPGCNKEDDLSIHHLVKRDVKTLVGLRRYFPIRHYWANKTILCSAHHDEVDECGTKSKNPLKARQSLCQKKIIKIKNDFEKVTNGGK